MRRFAREALNKASFLFIIFPLIQININGSLKEVKKLLILMKLREKVWDSLSLFKDFY